VLDNSSSNTIIGNSITNNHIGIWLFNFSSGCAFSGNDITANGYFGMWFDHSPSNNVTGNRIANNLCGAVLNSSSGCAFSGNNITANYMYGGIALLNSSSNSISRNSITANSMLGGVALILSFDCTISENNVADNTNYGVYITNSSNNRFFHNNFKNNTQQVSSLNSTSVWDDGYPSGGNYWSDYSDGDSYNGPNQIVPGSDGIGDTAYTIDANNVDHYPLMGPFTSFDAGTWGNTLFNVDVVSKSNITNFSFDPYASPKPTLTFDIEGQDGTTGFCRISIPRDIMWCDDPSEWTVTVGGTLTSRNIVEDADYTHIFVEYTHSTKTVQIQSTHAVPEFQPFLILPLLMTITLLATVICKRKRTTKTRT
jgi:parallel beta-helix repeat protein